MDFHEFIFRVQVLDLSCGINFSSDGCGFTGGNQKTYSQYPKKKHFHFLEFMKSPEASIHKIDV